MTASIGKLENLIGHKFQDIGLMERAVTHRSWAFENLQGESEEAVRAIENESMEFLGDSILGSIIAEQVYAADPSRTEGDMTLIKHHLVSTATLATIADGLGIGEFIRIGRGEEKTGGRKKQALLANTLEAVIAAVFLDGGYAAARVFVGRIFSDELKKATPGTSVDYKTTLQEVLQADRQSAPRYTVVETAGPPHAREFLVETSWNTGKARGRGSSIKAAEMMAAAEALSMLKTEGVSAAKRDGQK